MRRDRIGVVASLASERLHLSFGKLVPDDEIREVDLFSPKEKEFACKINPYQTGKLLIQANDSRWS